MQRPYRAPPRHPRRIDDQSAMRTAFIEALAQRVEARPSGIITLPTGRADAGEVAHVLRALDRARAAGGHQ